MSRRAGTEWWLKRTRKARKRIGQAKESRLALANRKTED